MIQARGIRAFVATMKLISLHNSYQHDGLFDSISVRAKDLKVNVNKNWTCGNSLFPVSRHMKSRPHNSDF